MGDTYHCNTTAAMAADAANEKATRGALRSAVERALANKKAVTVLDSLNNIKVWMRDQTEAI